MHLAKLYNSKIVKNYIFCFFGRKGGVSSGNFSSLNCSFNEDDKNSNVVKNRKIINESLGSQKKIIFLNQVHSTKVEFIDRPRKKILTADSMFTCRKDIFLGILTADCAPLIVLGKKYFGIIHVGWKGALDGVIENTIGEMMKKGEKIHNFYIFIGPHLMKSSFEIKNDFLNLLLGKSKQNEKYIDEFENKKFFDFSMFILDKINKVGIKKIEISRENTYTNNSKYFSNRFFSRRGIKNCGRQISLVGIKD